MDPIHQEMASTLVSKGEKKKKKRPFQRAFKIQESFLRKKSQYTVTCMYQAEVHFKIKPHISAEHTHIGVKKFSLFCRNRRPV